MHQNHRRHQGILISLLFFLMSIACQLPAQNRDSLLQIWESTTFPDTQRLQAARELVKLIRPTNPGSSLKVADAMLSFARERQLPRWMLKACTSRGISYAYLGNFPEALDNFERSKTLSEEIGDRGQLLGATVNVGNIYFNQGDYYSALANYEQSLGLAEELRDTNTLIAVNNNLGSIHSKQGDLEKAMLYHQHSKALSEILQSPAALARAYYNIGIVLSKKGRNPKALKHLQQSMRLRDSIGDTYDVARVLGEIGVLYYEIGDLDRAHDYFSRYASMARELEDQDALAKAYDHLASLYNARKDFDHAMQFAQKSLTIAEEMGMQSVFASAKKKMASIYKGQGKAEQALEKYQESLDLYLTLGESGMIADVYAEIGQIHLAGGRFAQAGKWCAQARDLARQVGTVRVMKEACGCLAGTWESLGDYRQAYVYQKEFDQLRDSLIDEEKAREIARLEMGYVFEKEKLADSLAFAKQQAAIEARLTRERNTRKIWMLGSAGLMIFLSMGGFVLMRLRENRQKTARQAEDLEREKLLNEVTSKFVPNAFLRTLGKERITEVALGDLAEREVTVFFSDIRGYTSMAERMTPKDNFKFINSLYGRIGPLIRQHQGFVNHYLGDAIMALFPERLEDALNAAVDIQNLLRNYNYDREAHERQPVKLGIGLYTGPLVMGIIGDDKRMDAATLSDTVNTAARVESLTKYFGANILCGKRSAPERTADSANIIEINYERYLGPVQVKGKQEIVHLYECFGGDPPRSRTLKLEMLPAFETALVNFLNGQFQEAAAEFGEILKANPGDQPAGMLLRKTERYLQQGAPDDWTGVEVVEVT